MNSVLPLCSLCPFYFVRLNDPAIRPGFVWQLPCGERFNRRGKWVLGVAVDAEYGPDGVDLGLGARLRIDLDFKKLIGRKR